MRTARSSAAFGLGLAAFAGAAAPALANDFNVAAFGKGLALMMAYSPVTWIVYAVFVSLIEALVLRLVLKIGYRWSLLYAVAANAVSTVIGALWYMAGEGMGWKTAWMMERWQIVVPLLLRSYLVTVAEESVVIALILRKRFDIAAILKVVAAANAVSYALTVGFMALP